MISAGIRALLFSHMPRLLNETGEIQRLAGIFLKPSWYGATFCSMFIQDGVGKIVYVAAGC